jgi:RHS repeat-associated protein
VSYAYDAEGRRASRTAGGATVNYLYAMGQEIAEYTGAAPGTLAARHVPGPGLDEPLATVTGTPASRVRVWHHADAQGSVIARSDGIGMLPAAAERYTYTPYGLTGPGSGAAQAGFRWLGRRLEPAAPTTLYDMRARAYAAGIGRFMQPDPIGTEGGLNLYAYVRNSPLNDIDTSGLIGFGASGGSIARLQGKGAFGGAGVQLVNDRGPVPSTAIRGIPGRASGSAPSGQLHHGISRPVHEALEAHPHLTGVYQHRDPRLVARAAEPPLHQGYQLWYRQLDREISSFIRSNPGLTQQQFERYLQLRYNQPDLRARFPGGIGPQQ